MAANTSPSRISRILRRSWDASASGKASATMPSAAKRAAKSLTSLAAKGSRAEESPCLRALRFERSLPSTVRGPVLRLALRRLAACFSEEVIGTRYSAASVNSMSSISVALCRLEETAFIASRRESMLVLVLRQRSIRKSSFSISSECLLEIGDSGSTLKLWSISRLQERTWLRVDLEPLQRFLPIFFLDLPLSPRHASRADCR